jgi:hypothetical protein
LAFLRADWDITKAGPLKPKVTKIGSGLSQRQAAKVLGVDEGTVRNRLRNNCADNAQQLRSPMGGGKSATAPPKPIAKSEGDKERERREKALQKSKLTARLPPSIPQTPRNMGINYLIVVE